MAPTHSRQIERMTAKNGTRLLRPAIGLKIPDRGDEGKHTTKKLNVVLTQVKQIALPTRFHWNTLGIKPLKSGYCSRRN